MYGFIPHTLFQTGPPAGAEQGELERGDPVRGEPVWVHEVKEEQLRRDPQREEQVRGEQVQGEGYHEGDLYPSKALGEDLGEAGEAEWVWSLAGCLGWRC